MNSLNISNQRAITSLLTLYLLVSPADNLNAYLLTLRYSVIQIQEMCLRCEVNLSF